MEGITGFFKRTPEITNSLTSLIKGKEFQDSLKAAGSIGALITIGIDMYKQIKDGLKTEEERAFGSLIQIAFESAKESLVPVTKNPIEKANTNDIKMQLFNTFIKPEEGWNSYLPDHPVIVQFRSYICDILRNEELNDHVRDFVFNFNLRLEDKVDKDKDRVFEPFKERAILIKRNTDLIKHLEYSRSLIYKVNPVDQRCLSDYYVENDAIIDDLNNWIEEEKLFSGRKSKVSYLVDNFLNETNWMTIIGAPFGIGKTSLSIKLASQFADNYLKNPSGDRDYIPIFAPLKDKLMNIDESQQSISEKIKAIAPGEEAKKRKILLIGDGLDEYGNTDDLLEKLQNMHEELPNLKVIITTRLNSELLEKIFKFGSQFIRLLSFDSEQVDEFFRNYGLPTVTFESLKSSLGEEETSRKPLFCWMYAIMMKSKSYSELTFEGLSYELKRSLIYQGFIHSIIRGKHKRIAKTYHWAQYYSEEKNILRKIAALVHMHNGKITKSAVIEGLKNYGIKYNENMIREVLMPILTSYFYLDSTSPLDMSVEFIHRSFGEYLLAEYYIDSIFEDKVHYLHVGLPSRDTLDFLGGLLELLKSEIENVENSTGFINSFSVTQSNDRRLLLSNFIKNVQGFFEGEQIIYQSEDNQQDRKWHITKYPSSKYSELWVHRWLSHYILNRLDESKSNNEILVELIQMTSHTIPPDLRRMVHANLTNADLALTNFSYSDLSHINMHKAKLSGANLSGAILRSADLSYADLSNANLSNGKLEEANLSNAILSNADLSNANLSNANLSNANLSDANLSGAILLDVNLSNAILSNANLSNADLTHATGANLSDVILRNTTLPANDDSKA